MRCRKHIRVLEASGMVARHGKGRGHILSINPGSLDEIDGWIERNAGLLGTAGRRSRFPKISERAPAVAELAPVAILLA
jgi:hypothetical protein